MIAFENPVQGLTHTAVMGREDRVIDFGDIDPSDQTLEESVDSDLVRRAQPSWGRPTDPTCFECQRQTRESFEVGRFEIE